MNSQQWSFVIIVFAASVLLVIVSEFGAQISFLEQREKKGQKSSGTNPATMLFCCVAIGTATFALIQIVRLVLSD